MNVGFDVQPIGMQAAADIKKNSGNFSSHAELGCPKLPNWDLTGFSLQDNLTFDFPLKDNSRASFFSSQLTIFSSPK
jgi:hypothetical protein